MEDLWSSKYDEMLKTNDEITRDSQHKMSKKKLADCGYFGSSSRDIVFDSFSIYPFLLHRLQLKKS